MTYFIRIVSVLVLIAFCSKAYTSSAEKFDEQEFNSIKETIKEYIHSKPDSAYPLLKKAQRIAEKNDDLKQKLFVYENLGKYFSQKNNPDSAKSAFAKGIKLARKVNNKQKLYSQISELAYIYNKTEKYDTSLTLYKKAIKFFKEQNDTIALGTALSSQGSALMGAGLNKKALNAFYKAEQYLQKTDKYLNLGAVYENIALINAKLGYDSLTIKYYKKAIPQYEKLEDTTHLAQAYVNVGVSFKRIGGYDSSMHYYKRARQLADNMKDDALLAQIYSNTGNIMDKQGQTREAIDHYEKSLQFAQKANLPPGRYFNYVNIAEIRIRQKNYKKAVELLNKAVPIGKAFDLPEMHLVYKNLYEAHKKMNHPAMALQYHEKMAKLRDSIYQARKHQELMELQTKYETKKKEAQIFKLEKEKKQEELMRSYLLSGLIGVVIVALIIVLWISQRRAKIKAKSIQLEKENQKKNDQLEKLKLTHQLEKAASEKYQLDLQFKEQELVYQTLKQAELANKNKAICEKMTPFKHRLSRKKDQEQFEKALNEITNESSREPLSDFEQMFLQMHGNFYEKLLGVSPDLSRSELEMCSLLRMNLPSKEIANVLNLAISTIDQRRHSIRKKLNLENQQNLISYLIAL